MSKKKIRLAVIGLGYVGLPLSVEFAKKRKVIGYDVSIKRINELNSGFDKTCEVNNGKFKKSKNLILVKKLDGIKNCNCYIITVPTPINKKNKPDLSYLLKATKEIGKILKPKDIVIYESTVYPGCTEEKCVPILESESGLKYNREFFCGYSPERINPGDNKHKLKNIKKIISGSNKKTTNIINDLYGEIIIAGTHKTKSIIVAEAAKVIENTQRDLNIALINELSLIFNKLNINTSDVISAAKTKWNFMPFLPGLVGGHCIGVDPYYLAQKSQELGYNPEIILSGRRINDSMGEFIASEFVKLLIKSNHNVKKSKILILGLTFKENCPDHRNTKVVDLVKSLKNYDIDISLYDPWVDKKSFEEEYKLKITDKIENVKFDGIILAVSHDLFKKINLDKIKSSKESVVYDVKGFFDFNLVTKRL